MAVIDHTIYPYPSRLIHLRLNNHVIVQVQVN